MPTFSGIHHVALTVTDLAVSVRFYEKLLGSSPVTMTDGPFTRQVFAPARRAGLGPDPAHRQQRSGLRPDHLDHVGLACADRDQLLAWPRLNNVGIAHSGVKDADYGSAVSFPDPDGNALEFFASA